MSYASSALMDELPSATVLGQWIEQLRQYVLIHRTSIQGQFAAAASATKVEQATGPTVPARWGIVEGGRVCRMGLSAPDVLNWPHQDMRACRVAQENLLPSMRDWVAMLKWSARAELGRIIHPYIWLSALCCAGLTVQIEQSPLEDAEPGAKPWLRRLLERGRQWVGHVERARGEGREVQLGKTMPMAVETDESPPTLAEPMLRLVHSGLGLGELFVARSQAQQAQVQWVQADQLGAAVANWLGHQGHRQVAVAPGSLFEQLGLAETLREQGIVPCGPGDCPARLGMADGAVAETGSVLLRGPKSHWPLVPGPLALVVHPKDIVPDLLDLAEAPGNGPLLLLSGNQSRIGVFLLK